MEIDDPRMPAPQVRERSAFGMGGMLPLLVSVLLVLIGLALMLVGVLNLIGGFSVGLVVLVVAGALLVVAGSVVGGGLIMVAPGEARVIQFLGRYVGTVRRDGLRWINPFTMRRKISTRIRNHETAVTKVNDLPTGSVKI